LALLVYLIASVLAGAAAGPTVGYVPAWAMLLALAGLGRAAGSRSWPWLIAGAILFVPSVTFRALDDELCDIFPRGTHFFWHLFNAGVLYCAGRGLVAHLAAPGADHSPRSTASASA
jgi:hypothetical protein